MLRPPVNRVLVKCRNVMNDEIQHGSLKLVLDTSYQPDWHRKIEATVAAVPDRIDTQHYAFKGITQEVNVGDRVYFHYLSLLDSNRIVYNDEDYYLIEYFNIFCTVKEGRINPVCGWVLVEPIKHKPVEKNGLITEVFAKTSDKKGRIAHIGKPLEGEPDLGLKTGDTILFSKNSDFENTIEGTKYFTMKQSDLMGIYE